MRTLLLLPLILLHASADEESAWCVLLPRKNASIEVCSEGRKRVEREDAATPRTPSRAVHDGGELHADKAGDLWQIFRRKERNAKGEQITWHEHHARDPRTSPDGKRVAYRVESPDPKAPRMKAEREDLWVLDLESKKQMRIEIGDFVTDFAWSPDGKTLAVAPATRLEFRESATGKLERTIDFAKFDKRLYAHGARGMLWRPDGGEIACAITFLGGRAAIAGEAMESMYGDHELFFVPLHADPRVVTLPESVTIRPCSWRRDEP